MGLSSEQINSENPAVLEDANQKRQDAIVAIDELNEATLSFVPLGEIGYKTYRDKDITREDGFWAGVSIVPAGKFLRFGKSLPFVSKAVRSALSNRVGKRGFTEVGYQFQKHAGRSGGAARKRAIPEGKTMNPATYNEVGYETFKEIWRAPGDFYRVGGFIEKRFPDGRGIRIQENGIFKGFLD